MTTEPMTTEPMRYRILKAAYAAVRKDLALVSACKNKYAFRKERVRIDRWRKLCWREKMRERKEHKEKPENGAALLRYLLASAIPRRGRW